MNICCCLKEISINRKSQFGSKFSGGSFSDEYIRHAAAMNLLVYKTVRPSLTSSSFNDFVSTYRLIRVLKD